MNKADVKLLILWEGEIRLAARLLKVAHKHANKPDYPQKLADAFNACTAALYGADDEKYSLMMTRADSIIREQEKQP